MTTKAKAEAEATESLDPAPAAAEYGKPDADGNRWHSVKEEGGVRVYLNTQDGRGLNLLAETETKGKNALKKFLEGGN